MFYLDLVVQHSLSVPHEFYIIPRTVFLCPRLNFPRMTGLTPVKPRSFIYTCHYLILGNYFYSDTRVKLLFIYLLLIKEY